PIPPVCPYTTLFRSEPETLTFQADFDLQPNFNLELQNRRWFARTQKNLNLDNPGWQFEGCLPVVLTTKLDWQRELTTAMQSVLADRKSTRLNSSHQI